MVYRLTKVLAEKHDNDLYDNRRAANKFIVELLRDILSTSNKLNGDFDIWEDGNYIKLKLKDRTYTLVNLCDREQSGTYIHTKLYQKHLSELTKYGGNLTYLYDNTTKLHYLVHDGEPVFVITDVVDINDDLYRTTTRKQYRQT